MKSSDETGARMQMKHYLDQLVLRFEQEPFIQDDPISIPHGFNDPRDQEIAGFLVALLAWGQRKTILNKMADWIARMQFSPYEFVRRFDETRNTDALLGFKHRTFNDGDAIWLTKALSAMLHRYDTLENAFSTHLLPHATDVQAAIQGFSTEMMTILPDTPQRLQKHLARPNTGSACKRLNMFLRWMVRGNSAVDLGIWRQISPRQLVLPLDVHSGRQARRIGILKRPQDDWRAAIELTEACRQFDANDPAKYDFAFFGLGVYGDEEFPHKKSGQLL